jgi:molecular chaperone DnaK
MSRNTIDFGIDLGTTNSEIAVVENGDVHILKNNDNTENTSSAIHVDKRGRLFVGRRAKERAEEDPGNVRIEFKRDMGLQQEYSFVASGRKMTPEECSAEVLKSLKSDVEQRTGEIVTSAVITVPAMFELPACDATRRAAQLAGIKHSPLLQEPIAAAIAYGFNTESDNVFWLVYDLGGGTFDASLISVRDGRISVVDHDGENHLGGKDLDWALLEELVIPQIQREHSMPDIQRGNTKFRSELAKLKAAGEKAKIDLSRSKSTILEVFELCDDAQGNPVDVDTEILQDDYARVIKPHIERSITICKRVLERNHLSSNDIEKLILVGGPTLTPAVRKMLEEGLGIPLDISVDPITAVAHGAAIFASAQPQPKEIQTDTSVETDSLRLEIAYEPITPDDEPFVGGKVLSDEEIPAGLRIEFIRGDGGWRSGALPVSQSGAFATDLRLVTRKPNTFEIELRDSTGNKLETNPHSLSITHGLGIDNPPLPRSLGVATADDRVQVYLSKDTQLPAKGRAVHRTAKAIARDGSEAALKIPIIEGEHPRARRNRLIGTLLIPAQELKRDLRANAEIEVRIEMDESRALKMSAYIPELDQEFTNVQGQTASQTVSPQVLEEELDDQRKRLKKLSEDVGEVQGNVADEIRDRLFMLEATGVLQEVERLVNAARGGEMDAAKTADERLKDMAAQLDEAEDALEWPRLETRAEEDLKAAHEAVQNSDASHLNSKLSQIEGELRAALRSLDKETVKARLSDIGEVWFDARQSDPNFWVALFFNAKDKPLSVFRDEFTARRLLQDGEAALNARDIPKLRRIVDDLYELLPSIERERAGASFGSGVV